MAGERAGGKPCVLVVDDEAMNRELLRRVLKRDVEVEEAEDARSAVAVLERRDDIVLVLCDQLMPGWSGCELARRARERWPALRFALLTGYDDDVEVKAAAADGTVHTVLAKPWEASMLRRTVAALLAG